MGGLFSFCLAHIRLHFKKQNKNPKSLYSEAPEFPWWARMAFSSLQILLSSLEFRDYEDEPPIVGSNKKS